PHHSLATVTGRRRRTGAPRSQRGTRLKATTDRAFLVSTGSPTPARATEKACPSLPGERAGKFPTDPTAAQFGPRVRGLAASPSCGKAEALRSENNLNESLSQRPFGGCYDRTYQGIPA